MSDPFLWLEGTVVILTGLCLGSFVTLASYRLPRDQDIIYTGSRCPNCEARLKARDLFPVLSWLLSGRKCRHCHKSIHWRYPLIEVITAVACTLVWWRYGLTLESLLLAVMTVALMIMIVADFEHYIIPDEVHFALIPSGLLFRYITGDAAMDIITGFAVALGTGLALCYGFRWLRKKEGLGFGDVKFLADVGVWIPIATFVPFLFISGVLGVLTALIWRALSRGAYYPFGPALAIALYVCMIYPEVPATFWSWQYTLLGGR